MLVSMAMLCNQSSWKRQQQRVTGSRRRGRTVLLEFIELLLGQRHCRTT